MSTPVLEARTILIPIDGSPPSMEAVELGCTFVRPNKGSVTVVHVIEVPRALPLDADLEAAAEKGEQFLSAAEGIAARADTKIDAELLQAREAGHAVVDEAAARGVDLILLGIEHHTPYGEFQLGRTTQYVMKNARCPVLIYRQRMPE
jgi:nucleotide-binding universal stress UspA family protein